MRDALQRIATTRFEAVRAVFARGVVREEIPAHDLDGRVERFISPFFMRRLATSWPIDADFRARQVAAAVAPA